jgi:hypothetical protein
MVHELLLTFLLQLASWQFRCGRLISSPPSIGANTMVRRSAALLAVAGAFAASANAQVFNGGLPSGYTCTAGNAALGCGTIGANGSITTAPGGGTQFGWVSTNGGSEGQGRNPLGIDGTRAGSTLTSGSFTSTAGQSLSFAFNYITSDGTGSFTDYAFVRLLSTGGAPPIILFTARTTPTGNTVPGNGLPGLAPGVTLTPGSTPITPGPVNFSPLGGSSGTCFSSPTAGCGFTGWIIANYVVPTAGTYQLEFNVFNVGDNAFQSALAFDFSTGTGGTPIVPPTNPVVPEPSTYVLMATGLLGLAGIARRRRAA